MDHSRLAAPVAALALLAPNVAAQPGWAASDSSMPMVVVSRPLAATTDPTGDLDTPRVFWNEYDTALVTFVGKPRFRPIKGVTGLHEPVNSESDLFLSTGSRQYFLLHDGGWLKTRDLASGAWEPAIELPSQLSDLPPTEKWRRLARHIPGTRFAETPDVIVSCRPAALIVTRGEPEYSPVPESGFMAVTNTDSAIYLDPDETTFYFDADGRWLRAGGLDGPWEPVVDVPRDLATATLANEKTGGPGDGDVYVLIDGVEYWLDDGTWFIRLAPGGPWIESASGPPRPADDAISLGGVRMVAIGGGYGGYAGYNGGQCEPADCDFDDGYNDRTITSWGGNAGRYGRDCDAGDGSRRRRGVNMNNRRGTAIEAIPVVSIGRAPLPSFGRAPLPDLGRAPLPSFGRAPLPSVGRGAIQPPRRMNSQRGRRMMPTASVRSSRGSRDGERMGGSRRSGGGRRTDGMTRSGGRSSMGTGTRRSAGNRASTGMSRPGGRRR